jgi:hypothetical protein
MEEDLGQPPNEEKNDGSRHLGRLIHTLDSTNLLLFTHIHTPFSNWLASAIRPAEFQQGYLEIPVSRISCRGSSPSKLT